MSGKVSPMQSTARDAGRRHHLSCGAFQARCCLRSVGNVSLPHEQPSQPPRNTKSHSFSRIHNDRQSASCPPGSRVECGFIHARGGSRSCPLLLLLRLELALCPTGTMHLHHTRSCTSCVGQRVSHPHQDRS